MLKRLPVFFFVVACLVNLTARYIGDPTLAAMVKPALMPLLSLSCVASAMDRRVDRRMLGLLVAAQLFGCAGDICLIRSEFIYFASGIGAFLIGHIFYLSLFGSKSWKKLSWKGWVPGILLILGAVAGLMKLLKVSGDLMPPMAVYGTVLMTLVFCTLCGFLRFREKGTWGILLCGALLFAFSDSLIAAQTFEVVAFPQLEFVIMLTYLCAQSLLAIGALRLIRK